MSDLQASYDYYENKIENLSVTLMCDNKNNLIAFTNKLNRLPMLKEPTYHALKNEVGIWVLESDEILLAMDGQKINFESASIFFPYLKDKKFWIDEKWEGYDGLKFEEIF